MSRLQTASSDSELSSDFDPGIEPGPPVTTSTSNSELSSAFDDNEIAELPDNVAEDSIDSLTGINGIDANESNVTSTGVRLTSRVRRRSELNRSSDFGSLNANEFRSRSRSRDRVSTSASTSNCTTGHRRSSQCVGHRLATHSRKRSGSKSDDVSISNFDVDAIMAAENNNEETVPDQKITDDVKVADIEPEDTIPDRSVDDIVDDHRKQNVNRSLKRNISRKAPQKDGAHRGKNKMKSKRAIGKLDISKIVKDEKVSTISVENERITYYHTNIETQLLEINSDVKPMEITWEGIKSLQNIDYEEIAIDYSNVPTKISKLTGSHKWETPCSLSRRLPPKGCRAFQRRHPFCCEIGMIERMLPTRKDANSFKQTMPNGPRFITFRHNLRVIVNAALYCLGKTRIYDRNGINIGIHRGKGQDIYLENISTFGTAINGKKTTSFAVDMVYGYLLEHALESLSRKHDGDIGAMDYHRVLDRNEIRALNVIRIGQDIECLCAAEMDAVMEDEANGQEKVIEIKSTKTNKKRRNNDCSKMKGISDSKLLKYWTQCRFGGVDAVLIAFHENGKVERTEIVDTVKLEKMFPIITAKCVKVLRGVLKWIQEIMLEQPEFTLYRLSFAHSAHSKKNSKFVLHRLRSKETQKSIYELLSDAKDRTANERLQSKGLVINSRKGHIELKSIM